MRVFLLLTGFIIPLATLATEDSIGVEVVDGKTYVLHRIEQGETLYRISVNYTVSVDDILKANPGLESSVYKAGQVIRVPSRSAPPAIVKRDDPKTYPGNPATSNSASHKVLPGETLYSIAKHYGLTVKQLMAMNDMTSADIRDGQVLHVSKPQDDTRQEVTVVTEVQPVDSAVLTASSDPTWTVESSGSTPLPYSTLYTAQVSSGAWVELEANGAVTWVPELRQQSQGYFALHKTIPVGSLIRVKNPINDKTIVAKVVGNLPGNTPDNVVLKLPSTAKQPLKIFDEVMYVQISYLVPKE